MKEQRVEFEKSVMILEHRNELLEQEKQSRGGEQWKLKEERKKMEQELEERTRKAQEKYEEQAERLKQSHFEELKAKQEQCEE